MDPKQKMLVTAKNLCSKMEKLAEDKNYVAIFYCIKRFIKLSVKGKDYRIPYDKVGIDDITTPSHFDEFKITNSETLELFNNGRLLFKITLE